MKETYQKSLKILKYTKSKENTKVFDKYLDMKIDYDFKLEIK